MARVLVVDDDIQIRSLYKQVLDIKGYECDVACNGQEAIDMIEAGDKPDLVITDIMMPVMNGLDMIKEVKGSYPNIKIIAISGNAREGFTLENAMKLGADFSLAKPLMISDLMNSVQECLAG